MNKKIIILILIVILGVAGTGLTKLSAATNTLGTETKADLDEQDDAFLSATGLGTISFSLMISNIIKILLSWLGVIFIILIIYGGFMWMTSAGNEEKIEKAKKILVSSIIGLTIVLAAYAITYFVIDAVLKATNASRSGLN